MAESDVGGRRADPCRKPTLPDHPLEPRFCDIAMLSVSHRRCPWVRHSPISNSGSRNMNKEDAMTVFVSVAVAHLPADIDRPSPLIAGSSQPDPPARNLRSRKRHGEP